MFTGIIETSAKIKGIENKGTNITFELETSLTDQLKVDQSIAHNGVCLTLVEIDLNKNSYKVDAIKETIDLTNLGEWEIGTLVNLERSMKAESRVDGHFVQGHVDTTATCKDIINENGSWRFYFSLNKKTDQVLIQKGSICINGVSLTLIDANPDHFSVAIIPFTYEHTNFNQLKAGSIVNIEFDILGKYIQKLYEKRQV